MIRDLRLKNKNHQSLIVNHKSPPIQYQKGYVEFYKLHFKVTPDVLIPRPETELLVDEVLAHARPGLARLEPQTILDIGTGAGNIAISIAKNVHPRGGFRLPPQVKIIATDISPKALKIAKQNAELHGIENEIEFLQSDLLSSVILNLPKAGEESYTNMVPKQVGRSFVRLRRTQDDNLIIVTNLPYIPSARIPYLDSSVKDYEPHIALDGDDDGFGLYRKLFSQISKLGWKPELIVCEIDYTHGELAAQEAQKYFPEAEIEVKTDLAHKQRILLIR